MGFQAEFQNCVVCLRLQEPIGQGHKNSKLPGTNTHDGSSLVLIGTHLMLRTRWSEIILEFPWKRLIQSLFI